MRHKLFKKLKRHFKLHQQALRGSAELSCPHCLKSKKKCQTTVKSKFQRSRWALIFFLLSQISPLGSGNKDNHQAPVLIVESVEFNINP